MMFWRQRPDKRVLFEDALKHIYHGEYDHQPVSNLSLAGALGVPVSQAVALMEQMARRGLITLTGDGLHLTPTGRAWALQVIRAHRLWESYLSNELGVPLEEIHKQAELKEHRITPSEVDALEAQLGFPTRDPHGDPIPSAVRKIEDGKGRSLLDWPVGKLAQIIHIEDEPQAVYAQILAEGLFFSNIVRVLEVKDQGVRVRTHVHECWLAPVVAANVFVEEAPPHAQELKAEPLSVLRPGETGRVVSLQSQGLTRRRFLDLGLVPGTLIRAVMPSALAEPVAYEVRGSVIALRREQADGIFIQRSASVQNAEGTNDVH